MDVDPPRQPHGAGHHVLVLGATRSGKSRWAEQRVLRWAEVTSLPVYYLATLAQDGSDSGVDDRVRRHRARRPPEWTTVEVETDHGGDLAVAVRSAPAGIVLVDSLGPWVGARLVSDADPASLAAGVAQAVAARPWPVVVVSEEVGWSVHPVTELGRRFVDALGEVNQALATAASDVVLVVAGRALALGPGVQP